MTVPSAIFFGGVTHEAVGDGSTDDRAAIQAAIDSASATSAGAFVYLPGTANGYAIADTLVLKSKALLVLGPSASIVWTGSSGGTMFRTSTSDPTQNCGVTGNGAVINGGGSSGAATIFDLHSPQLSVFQGLTFQSCRDSAKVFKIYADATNASGYESSRNAVFNQFSRLTVDSNCHTFFELSGDDSPAGFVTLNSFSNLEGKSILGFGIRVVQWSDNNFWDGYVRLELSGNNAVGLILNDAAVPSADEGVYQNIFRVLAVDTFAGPTGRKAIVLNKCKQTHIDAFYNTPAAEGAVIEDNNSDSHEINQGMPDGSLVKYIKGNTIKNAVGGNQVLVDTLGLKVLTPAGVTAFSVKASDGFVDCAGPIKHQSGIFDANLAQLLTTRRTGWTAATGTSDRTAFDTATVTTELLARRVKALLDDLIFHGMIGS